MGLCSTTPEVVEDFAPNVLKFKQSEEAFAANGGLTYRSPLGRMMPITGIGYDSHAIYFVRNDKEFIGTHRIIRN